LVNKELQVEAIVTEWCNSSLNGLIESKARVSAKARVRFAYDIACALAYLHSQNVIHCDLKPQNVLVSIYGRVKLCDFGLSKHAHAAGLEASGPSRQTLVEGSLKTPDFQTSTTFQPSTTLQSVTTVADFKQGLLRAETSTTESIAKAENVVTLAVGIGTSQFMAPEMVSEDERKKKKTSKKSSDTGQRKRINITNKVDVFAFGMIMYYLVTDFMPWDFPKRTTWAHEVFDHIRAGRRPELPEEIDRHVHNQEFLELMRRCWSELPTERPSMAEVVEALSTMPMLSYHEVLFPSLQE
jgi:serine/threonine protein kinase